MRALAAAVTKAESHPLTEWKSSGVTSPQIAQMSGWESAKCVLYGEDPSPLWSCQKQTGWCRGLLWQDRRPPTTPAPGLWSCIEVRELEIPHTHFYINTCAHTHTHSDCHCWSYLGLLLFRLRVISLTQCGCVITKLKPDCRKIEKLWHHSRASNRKQKPLNGNNPTPLPWG